MPNNEPNDLSDVAIVIPTLGNRPEYLEECVASLPHSRTGLHTIIVAPQSELGKIREKFGSQIIQFEIDPGRGLAAALNLAFSSLPEKVKFCTWLGDDDRLTPDSLSRARHHMAINMKAAACYGDIGIIDYKGNRFKEFKSSRLARYTVFWGPNCIPQPGSLIRRRMLEEVGLLDESFKFAFDADMFMRLSRVGKLVYVKYVLADFRWHHFSLSAGQSSASIREASTARRKNLPKPLRRASFLWESIHVDLAIALAGNSFDRALRRVGNEKSSSRP